MVERLAARLAAEPEDFEGWLRLARAYGVLGEAEQAHAALARAADLVAVLPADSSEQKVIKAARRTLPGAP